MELCHVATSVMQFGAIPANPPFWRKPESRDTAIPITTNLRIPGQGPG